MRAMYCDRIEVNTTYYINETTGEPMKAYFQLIFWNRYKCHMVPGHKCKGDGYHVCDFVVWSDDAAFVCMKSLKMAVWEHGNVVYVVTAGDVRTTMTINYDPEMADRKCWPLSLRNRGWKNE